VIHHQGRQRVVVQDGHAVALEYSAGLGGQDLIRGDFEESSIQSFEFKWRHGERVEEANIVLVHEVVAFSFVTGVLNGSKEDS
jgi:hypothetical protein